jgi:hypothetical protein
MRWPACFSSGWFGPETALLPADPAALAQSPKVCERSLLLAEMNKFASNSADCRGPE